MVVFWAAVIVGIVLLIRWLITRSVPAERRDSALDILRKRYAGGEISRDEYANMRKDLL